jgi:hypothetical protein
MSNSFEFPDTSEYICTTHLMTGFVRGKRRPCLLIPAIGKALPHLKGLVSQGFVQKVSVHLWTVTPVRLLFSVDQ